MRQQVLKNDDKNELAGDLQFMLLSPYSAEFFVPKNLQATNPAKVTRFYQFQQFVQPINWGKPLNFMKYLENIKFTKYMNNA